MLEQGWSKLSILAKNVAQATSKQLSDSAARIQQSGLLETVAEATATAAQKLQQSSSRGWTAVHDYLAATPEKERDKLRPAPQQ
jgi:hypothetical protein